MKRSRRARFEQVPLAEIAALIARGGGEGKTAPRKPLATRKQSVKDEPYFVRVHDRHAPARRRETP